jgi:hypothetical protein
MPLFLLSMPLVFGKQNETLSPQTQNPTQAGREITPSVCQETKAERGLF